MHLFSGNLRYVIEEPFLGISESTFFICWNFFPKQMLPFPELSFWLSSTGAAVLLSPPPLYVNSSPLFESQIERNISGTYFISIYLLVKEMAWKSVFL